MSNELRKPYREAKNNIDMVGLVHIADVPGRHEPGTGEIDYGSIYRELGEAQVQPLDCDGVLPDRGSSRAL